MRGSFLPDANGVASGGVGVASDAREPTDSTDGAFDSVGKSPVSDTHAPDVDGGHQVTRSRDQHTVHDPRSRYKHFTGISSLKSSAPRDPVIDVSRGTFTCNHPGHDASLNLRVTRGVPRETSLDSTDNDGSWVEACCITPGQSAGKRCVCQRRDSEQLSGRLGPQDESLSPRANNKAHNAVVGRCSNHVELTEQFWVPPITARRLTDDDHTAGTDTRHR